MLPRPIRYILQSYCYLVILVGLFLSPETICQPEAISFQTISVDDGLSQSSVFSVFQDKRGFLWLGTNDGLNRYDGYRFVVYKPDPENIHSITGNRIFVIFEDSKGTLWVGTEGGLNRYDRARDRFDSYIHNDNDPKSLINNQVHSICEDRAGRIWIGTRRGVSIYDRNRGTFENIVNIAGNNSSLSNNFVWDIFEDKASNIWVGTDRGLNKYNDKTKNFQRFYLTGDTTNRFYRNTVFSIYEDSYNNLWVGTRGGLFKKAPGEKSFKLITNAPSNPHSLSHNNVYSILEDSNRNLWVGTLGGGVSILSLSEYELNPDKGEYFEVYKNDAKSNGSISNNFVWSLFKDKSGIVWVGTDIGLNKFDPFYKRFNLLREDPSNPNSLISNDVTSILVDRENLLWFGTRNGLSCYDQLNKSFINYTVAHPREINLKENFIKSLYEDNDKNIWIGTNGGGLICYNKQTHQSIVYLAEPGKPGKLSDNKIMSICEDKQGILWLGTLGGLNRFDKKTGQFSFYKTNIQNPNSISNDYALVVFEDRDGILWIGTNDGLNKFEPAKQKFTRYQVLPGKKNGLSNSLIMSIAEDRNGILWVGTNGGLHAFDKKTEKFTRFADINAPVNNSIYGILQDKAGNLWLSTNKGLVKFNPQTKTVRSYTKADRLQSNQFNSGAAFLAKDGCMYFGGINGLNYFLPSQIQNNPVLPQVVITDFQIMNKHIAVSENSPLKNSITETKEIVLSYSDNVFSFEFAALHFAQPFENTYKYMLEGFDKEWQLSGTRRFVTYTNLDPGEYYFHVKGANNDGLWSEPGTVLKVVIVPPFWHRWWFIVTMCLLISALIYLGFYLRMRQLLAIERIRFNIAADLHDDIGTKLTEISMLSDMVYHFAPEQLKPEYENVNKIGNIARSMIDNLSDIIWLIKPEQDTLKVLFFKLKDSFEEILSMSNILLYFGDLDILDSIKLTMEQRKNLLRIIKEALHNSIKHSQCHHIWLSAEMIGKELHINVKDDGKGFDTGAKTERNGLVNMKKRAENIKGKLWIHSELNKGTTVTFIAKF